MTDRLTPAMLRDLADLMRGTEIHYSKTGEGPDVYFRDEAARREAEADSANVYDQNVKAFAAQFDAPPPRRAAEGFVPEAARQAVAVAAGLTSAPPIPDAPPTPAPDLDGLTYRLRARGTASDDQEWHDKDCLKAADAISTLRAERDAKDRMLDGARGCLAQQTARAEAAEADAKRLREALEDARGIIFSLASGRGSEYEGTPDSAVAFIDAALAQGCSHE